MRIECPNCHFSAETDKVPSGNVRVKCPKCGERFHLNPREDGALKADTPAPGEHDAAHGLSMDDTPEPPPAIGLDSGPPDLSPDLDPPSNVSEPELPPAIGFRERLDEPPDTGDPGLSSSVSEPEPPPAIGLDSGPPDLSITHSEPELPPAIGLDSDLSEPSSFDGNWHPPAEGQGEPKLSLEDESPEPGQWPGLDPADLTPPQDKLSNSQVPGLELASDFVDSGAYEQPSGVPDGIGLDPGAPSPYAATAPAFKVHDGKAGVGSSRDGGGLGGGGTMSRHHLTFHGTGKTLLGIYVVNVLLTIITLGVYHCWGKVKTRKYLYSSTELMRGRFTFTGTGRELFAGRMKATGLLVVIFGGPQVLANSVHPALALLVIPAMLLIMPVARVSAMRYRFCRTLWHNVQFSFRGTVKEGLKVYLTGTLLTIVTLGFYYPFFYADKQAFFRGNTRFGSESFSYDGKGKELFGTFFLGLLLTPLTLGLWWFWLKARLARYDWEHTSFQGMRFSTTVTGASLLGLKLVNLLILAFTLGLGYPWVVKRNMEFNFRHLKIEGDANLSKIFQTKENARAVGEGLLDQLDMDFAI